MCKRCVIIGQKNIKMTVAKVKRLYSIFENMARDGVREFYFGRISQFSRLCMTIVCGLKAKDDRIKRISILTEKLRIDEKVFLKYYEGCFLCESDNKKSFVVANEKAIDICDKVVCYFDPNSKSAESKLAYEYSQNNGKEVFNIFQ